MDKDKGYNDINDSIKKALDIMESPQSSMRKKRPALLKMMNACKHAVTSWI